MVNRKYSKVQYGASNRLPLVDTALNSGVGNQAEDTRAQRDILLGIAHTGFHTWDHGRYHATLTRASDLHLVSLESEPSSD
jgi:hypothetical protein